MSAVPTAPRQPDAIAPSDVLGSRIVVVDDDEIALEGTRRALALAGFARIEARLDARETLADLSALGPDIVISDLLMPGMDGLEFVRAIRAIPAYEHLPILVQTGFERPEERAGAFEAGASDLVTKPISPRELVVRVRTLLENRRLIKQLSVYRQRMDEELRTASVMQKALLPKDKVIKTVRRECGLALDAVYEASLTLGGDIWGLAPLGEGRALVYIADFSGHGVAAALNTVRLSTFIERSLDVSAQPSALLDQINRFLCGELPIGQFATMLLGVFDTRSRRFAYATAGADAPIRIAGAARRSEFAPVGGPILRLSPDARFETRSVPFEPGDELVLYSDGLTEAPHADRPYFTPAQLLSSASEASRALAAEGHLGPGVATRLRDELAGAAGRTLTDDLTAVSFRFMEPESDA